MNARLSFDAELESLSASLIRMGALATDAIDKAIEALEANDGALAQSVIAGDRNIDDMERSICASSPWRATFGKYPRPSR